MISNATLRYWLRAGDCSENAMEDAADRWADLEGAFAELSTENDRLLAINADLYEALELLVDTNDNGGWPSAAIVVARAALAKARGEQQ
ncbi:MAG: hypothetical protein ACRC16_22010 [Aeromonas salmonicida]